jgi:hypothetical protein
MVPAVANRVPSEPKIPVVSLEPPFQFKTEIATGASIVLRKIIVHGKAREKVI